MTNSQIENEEIESLKRLELNDDSSSDRMIETPAMQTKLLHHLVEVSKAFQKRPGDREAEELLKANNALVNELLNAPLKPAAAETANALKNHQAAWNEILVQKLIDGKVDPADEVVKELVSKLADELVSRTRSVKRFEDKVTFVMDTIDTKIANQKVMNKTVFLRGLSFKLTLYPALASVPVGLYVYCKKIPVNMTFKAKIEATIKNHTGKRDWVRSFIYVYSQKSNQLSILSLIERDEYEDESCGLVKDGKLEIEIVLQADELVEVKKESLAKVEPSQVTATETKAADA